MKRRLLIGLAAGSLMAAMLPGVAGATPGNPEVWNFGQCKVEGGASGDIGPFVVNKNGPQGLNKLDNERWLALIACA